MSQIRLQRLKLRFRLLFLGQVYNEAGKIALITDFCFPDFQLQRKGCAIFPAANDGSPDTDNPLFIGFYIALDIAVMRRSIRFGHQDFDIFTDYLFLIIAEHLFCRRAERTDQAIFINHDHGVGYGCQDRFQYGIGAIQFAFGRSERG